jgi:hypothetical protein
VARQTAPPKSKPRNLRGFDERGVSEGTRTPDRLDHNQELYQLSYAHQAPGSVTGAIGEAREMARRLRSASRS